MTITFVIFSENFPYFRAEDDRWKNSVRHNLSMNPHFRLVTDTKQLNIFVQSELLTLIQCAAGREPNPSTGQVTSGSWHQRPRERARGAMTG